MHEEVSESLPLDADSLLVRLAGDWRSLLPGPSAGLMQLLHPAIGAGVADHSEFFTDPFGRVYRSIPQIWATLLATDGEERGRKLRDLHHAIKGTDHRGQRYHALDPEVFWWAHATFTWEMFRAVELFFRRQLTPPKSTSSMPSRWPGMPATGCRCGPCLPTMARSWRNSTTSAATISP